MAKDTTQHIRNIPGAPDSQVNATVVRNRSIRIYGILWGNLYDKYFEIGDMAEYDSYNLSYMGTIVSITDKNVTIQPRVGGRKRRLSLYQFSWRNRDFDFEAKTEENSRTMMYI